MFLTIIENLFLIIIVWKFIYLLKIVQKIDF